MGTEVIKLTFTSPVHIGKKRLSDGEMTIAADTLFSALFIEALQLSLHTRFLLEEIVLSDTFPYDTHTYYLPKPLLDITGIKQGDVDFKQYKKLQYIPYERFIDYVNGEISAESARKMNEQFDVGTYELHTKAAIEAYGLEKETDDAEPFSIGSFTFHPGTGLYFVASGSADALNLLHTVLDSLQYAGIGGKRSIGYGQFTYEVVRDDALVSFFQQDGDRNILLSTAMAADDEINGLKLSGDDRFMLQRRSGFIQSSTFAYTVQKKRDFYSFTAGSVFQTKFIGNIFDVSEGGNHPVYRYAKAFWLEV